MLQEMKDANASHTEQINILTNSLVNLTNALTATLHRPLHVSYPQQQCIQSPVQGGSYRFAEQVQCVQELLTAHRKRHVNFLEDNEDDKQNFVVL